MTGTSARCPLVTWSRRLAVLLRLAVVVASFIQPSPGVSTYPCAPPCRCAKHNQTLTVNCSGQGLTHFPPDLPLTHHYKLLLSHNRLSRLDLHAYLHRVAYLDLSHNQVVSVAPRAITVLREQVQVLLLHGNRLRHIPQQLAFTPFKHLRRLTLHENPLVCDCRSRWLKFWLRNTALRVVRRRDIVCMNRQLYGRPVMTVPDAGFPCPLRALRQAEAALQNAGSPVVLLVVTLLAVVFMWMALLLLYRFCKTSTEIKWIEGAKWTALVETE